MSRRFLFIILTFVSLFVAACGEKETVIDVQSIAISQPSAEMEIGETLTLKANVSPSNASYDGLNWTSTNPKIASVSTSGLVTALSEGNTTITVMAGGKTASCAITVVKGFVAVTSISLNKVSLEMVEGDSESLTVTVLPNDATDKTVTWASSKESVAVIKDGIVSAISPGETTITARSGDQTATCKVTVKERTIAVELIELNKTELALFVGESETLTAIVKPDEATDKSISWTSSDTLVATVENGIVIAISEGLAIIAARAGEITETCSVDVLPIRVESVSISKPILQLYVGETEQLNAIISPSNATNQKVSWGSDNPIVATVTPEGFVKANNPGQATIMVITDDSWKYAYCNVTVLNDYYEAVDLGLSVKWSSYNYGATTIEQVGGYYVWGDPTGQAIATYSYNAPDLDSISGSQYDIVRMNWGGQWRIPTSSEIEELYNNCTWIWTTNKGVRGVQISGCNGNSIFIPVSGVALPGDGPIGTTTIVETDTVFLMSANSYIDSYGRFAYIYSFSPNQSFNLSYYNVGFGKIPIRPVR